MLLAHHPVAFVVAALFPGDLTISMLLIFAVLSFVATAVWPVKYSFAVHFIKMPLSVIASAIWPDVLAVFLDNIVSKFSRVLGPVLPLKSASSVLLSTLVLSFVDCIVVPGLCAHAMLQVHDPLSIVSGAAHVLKFT